MKILQVNCVYDKGSTGKITADLHRGFTCNKIESVVCYGRGKKVRDPNVYKVCSEAYSKFNNLLSRFTGVVYGGCFFSTNKLIRIIKREKPDIVHLQCINGYFVNIFRLVGWLKKNNIKTVLTLHAEFMFTANCGNIVDCEKWKTGCGNCPKLKSATKSLFFDRTAYSFKKMKKAFDGFENGNLTVVSVSSWLMKTAEKSPILSDKHHTVVMNGLDTSIFYPHKSETVKSELGITDEKIIFHVTPDFNNDPTHLKGGYFVIKVAEKLLGENVKIIVAGNYPENLKVPDNIVLLGNVSDQNKLAELYSVADITLITSKQETFSMVCAESLCCGTPVAGFKAGGPETIAISDYTSFANYGDIDEVIKNIHSKLYSETDKNTIAKEALNLYSKEKMLGDYLKIYKLMSKQN